MLAQNAVRELRESRGWTPEFVEAVYPYYVATLRSLAEGRPTTVFRVVDDMWHAHILCTRDYADFCTREFGRFVHHERSTDDSSTAPPVNATDFLGRSGLSLASLERSCQAHPRYIRSDTGPIGPTALATAVCSMGDPPSRLTTASCSEGDEKPPSQLAAATCSDGDVPPKQLAAASCSVGDDAPPNQLGDGDLQDRQR